MILKASPWRTVLAQNKPTVAFQTRPNRKKQRHRITEDASEFWKQNSNLGGFSTYHTKAKY